MHFIIPLLILLVAFPKIDKRIVVGLAFLALVPDLDFFINFTHRFLFHNLFFPVVLSSVIYLLTKNMQIFLISFYYLTSHIILDLTVGAVALFWPFYQRLIEVVITFDSRWKFIFDINTYSLKAVEDHMIKYPSYFFTQEGILVILLFVILLVIAYWKEIKKFLKK